MKSSDANLKRNGVRMFLRRHVAPLLVCAALLSMLTTPGFLMAQTDANASGATVTAQTPHQARMQAERRAEIRQRKIDNPEAEEGENVYRHSATVKKLAGVFGLSVETTSRLFEIINFVLLLALIVWGIAKLLPKTLRARTERIRSEIEQARIATEDANRRLANVEERLSRLDSEIETIRTQAEHETALEEQRLRAAMEQEKKSILDSATQNINAATKNAQSQLKKLAADLVIEHAKRQIAISPETDRTLVTGFLADVSDKQPRGGVN